MLTSVLAARQTLRLLRPLLLLLLPPLLLLLLAFWPLLSLLLVFGATSNSATSSSSMSGRVIGGSILSIVASVASNLGGDLLRKLWRPRSARQRRKL